MIIKPFFGYTVVQSAYGLWFDAKSPIQLQKCWGHWVMNTNKLYLMCIYIFVCDDSVCLCFYTCALHSKLERLEKLQVLLPRFTNGIWAANPENSLRKTFIPNLSSSACVAMWCGLIRDVWEEINARFTVVEDSNSVVNIVHCMHKRSLFCFFFSIKQ